MTVEEFDALAYGNLAYDFNAIPASEPEVEVPARDPHERHPRTRDDAKVSIGRAAAPRSVISPFAVIGTCVVMLLLFLVVVGYMKLTELSAQCAEYSSELEQLNAEGERLKIQYESAFNLDEVERYAISELGMIKADSTQIAYVHRAAGDQAVILAGEGERGFFGTVEMLLSEFLEYFR